MWNLFKKLYYKFFKRFFSNLSIPNILLVPELYVQFISETELRLQLWKLHEWSGVIGKESSSIRKKSDSKEEEVMLEVQGTLERT